MSITTPGASEASAFQAFFMVPELDDRKFDYIFGSVDDLGKFPEELAGLVFRIGSSNIRHPLVLEGGPDSKKVPRVPVEISVGTLIIQSELQGRPNVAVAITKMAALADDPLSAKSEIYFDGQGIVIDPETGEEFTPQGWFNSIVIETRIVEKKLSKMTFPEALLVEQGPPTIKRMQLTAVHSTGLEARGLIPYRRQLALDGVDVEVIRVDTDAQVNSNDSDATPQQWAVVAPIAISEALTAAGQIDEGAFWSGYHYAEILKGDGSNVIKTANTLSAIGIRDAANFWYGRVAAEDVTEVSQQISATEIYIPLTAGRLYEVPANLGE